MSIIAGTFLVYILTTSPIISVQVVQQTDSVELCQAQIAMIAEQEKDEKESEQIAPRLKCLGLSFNDHSEDAPKKSPTNLPSKPDYSCRNKITKKLVPCLEA